MALELVALFGQAEKGEYRKAHHCRSLDELARTLGHPPAHTYGLYFAIQALMYNHPLIFFRVEEEGYSTNDYMAGLAYLQEQVKAPDLSAIGLPGVGDAEIIDASVPICLRHKSLLLFSESDLYDYLTAGNSDLYSS